MNNLPKEIPALFLDPAMDLAELEKEIRFVLIVTWVLTGLFALAGAGALACTLS